MEKNTLLEQILLLSLLVTMSGASYDTPTPGGSSPSAILDHQTLRSKFCLKDRFRRVLNLHQADPHRQKRLVHFRLKLPHESEFQLKWAILLPVPAEEKYETDCAVELEWIRLLPSYLADDEYEPHFSTLFGSADPTHEEENPIRPEFLGGERRAKSPSRKKRRKKNRRKKAKKRLKRPKRSLHVFHRLGAYEVVEELFKKLNVPPKECLLRTVCEVAEAPLHYGVVGDFLNLLMTPSAALLSAGGGDADELSDYVAAEAAGRDRGECSRRYGACPSSMFDLVPFIRHKVLDFTAPLT